MATTQPNELHGELVVLSGLGIFIKGRQPCAEASALCLLSIAHSVDNISRELQLIGPRFEVVSCETAGTITSDVGSHYQVRLL